MLAEGLDIPLEHIYGVSTFYAQFNLNPKGRYRVGVCLGTACYVKNAASVFEKIKEVLALTTAAAPPTENSLSMLPAAWAAAVLLPS